MIKKGLEVKILVGKDKNKTGEVIEIDRLKNRLKVKGANIIKKHIKTTKDKKGGIVEKENFIHISNISVIETKGEHSCELRQSFFGAKKNQQGKQCLSVTGSLPIPFFV